MTFILFALVILGLLLFFTYKLVFIPYSIYRPYVSKKLPGYFFPLIGYARFLNQQFKLKNDCFAYYKELPKKEPDVKAHVSHFGGLVLFELLDPKMLKEFYDNSHCYEKSEFAPAMQTLVGTGLIQARGNMWKQHRKVISGLFHFEFMKQNIPLIVNTTKEFLEQLARRPRPGVDIMDEIQKITGEIVGRIFFGENLNRYTMEGQPLTLFLSNLLVDIYKNQKDPLMILITLTGGKLSWVPAFKKIMKKVADMRQMCYKIVNDRKESGIKSHDMLGLMLETQGNFGKDEAFSNRDIVNEFMTFFVGGMDTTGHTVAMALYLLNNHPEHLEALKAEIRDVYDQEEVVSQDTLNRMEFTHAIVKETLRMYSPVPGILPRIAIKDHKLLDVEIKAGMDVRPNPIYNCFNPKYFEEPEKFKPERWLNKSMGLDPFVYIPFSAGSRNCIGQHLSVMEMKIILAEFVKRFDFEVTPGYKLRMTANFLYEPADKITLNVVPRCAA